MEKTFEELKAEAIQRGFVKGAECESAYGTRFTMPDESNLYVRHTGSLFAETEGDGGRCVWDNFRNQWATVINPAPASPDNDVLGPNMACEVTPAMRRMIAEDYEQFGHEGFKQEMHGPCSYTIIRYYGKTIGGYTNPRSDYNFIPVHDFLRRLENMKRIAEQKKPIMISGEEVKMQPGHIVAFGKHIANEDFRKVIEEMDRKPMEELSGWTLTFNKTSVRIGCQTIPHDILREIASRLID
jgi:hypothetical protein